MYAYVKNNNNNNMKSVINILLNASERQKKSRKIVYVEYFSRQRQ